MIDNRVTLPLDVMRDASRHLCRMVCQGGVHVRPCFQPYLDERDALLAQDEARRYTEGLDPDCVVGGAKHAACTGCSCSCHRHSNRT